MSHLQEEPVFGSDKEYVQEISTARIFLQYLAGMVNEKSFGKPKLSYRIAHQTKLKKIFPKDNRKVNVLLVCATVFSRL